MQWILDLRTYGMKIHYNTTTKGHVGWNGQEQLLYQGIQFTMAKFRDGNTWLFNRIMGITAVRKRFTRKNTSSGISRQAVDAYAANTAKGGHRNVFIEDGLVVFVTRYHKGYAMSGDVKVIHRYLPREVGELVVWYLWLVLPFHQRMLAVVRGSEQISAYIWPAEVGEKRWTTERMREAMKKESRIGLG
ncbi:putative DNA helicase protein [Neofusicoccum parvum]|nr:putative DNA helicase protein [Neofusicoccum parvum]